ncbi:collagen-binding domain-containing protein, partial [Catellicoccus marimammalium]|uniref:collagen-binding domain-containing protein n=1 Tax=Catellicoccus marimammalium TaxID=300419 RepID=UPI00058C3973
MKSTRILTPIVCMSLVLPFVGNALTIEKAGITPTSETIYTDKNWQELGISPSVVEKENPLGISSLFHIFANNVNMRADVNGNVATNHLKSGNDFGVRNPSLENGYNIDYIENIDGLLASNAFRGGTKEVVFGPSIQLKSQGNSILVNGTPMTHLNNQNTVQENKENQYIDINQELSKLSAKSNVNMNTPESNGVKKNFSDMNNKVIDVSKATPNSDGNIYVNIPYNDLNAPQPITISGVSSDKLGPDIIINVTNIPKNASINTQINVKYDDGSTQGTGEEHQKYNKILWNFGSEDNTINFNSGRFMGSILAPNSTINAGVNIDGNIVAKDVNISGGESHSWPLQNTSHKEDSTTGSASTSTSKDTSTSSTEVSTSEDTSDKDHKGGGEQSSSTSTSKDTSTSSTEVSTSEDTSDKDHKGNGEQSSSTSASKDTSTSSTEVSTSEDTSDKDHKGGGEQSSSTSASKDTSTSSTGVSTSEDTNDKDHKGNGEQSSSTSTSKDTSTSSTEVSTSEDTNDKDHKGGGEQSSSTSTS